MANYEIGFGKPPKETRFKPGTSGNKKGRPRRSVDRVAEVASGFMDAVVKYPDRGRTKTTSRREFRLKYLVEQAKSGDIAAAAMVLKKRKLALKQGEAGSTQILVTDWLPDYLGQTAEEKMKVMSAEAGAAPSHTPPGRRQDSQDDGAELFSQLPQGGPR